MTNWNGRQALRGVEDEVLDFISDTLTSEQWAELLKVPLERAAAWGNRNLAKKLVEAGAEIGDALHEAVKGGNEGVVDDLLEHGSSVDSTNSGSKTPLHHAAQNGNAAMVKLLLVKGADKDALDSQQWTPLYLSTFFGHVLATLALLADGANINLRYNTSKSTVVHVAAQKGNDVILEAAIEHGADVNAADVYKDTPLHEAGSFNNVGAIDVLVDAGANMAARNGSGCTPLHHAAIDVRLEASRYLLGHGADVNSQNKNNETPLYYAACSAGTQGAAELVDILLRSGADETIADGDGVEAAEVVGSWVEEEDRLAEDVERVRRLLAHAQADRTWRCRGYLVLCRAHLDRLHHHHHHRYAQDGSGAHDGTGHRTGGGVRLERADSGDCNEMVVGESAGGDWASVVAKVLALEEEDIFRTIVGFL